MEQRDCQRSGLSDRLAAREKKRGRRPSTSTRNTMDVLKSFDVIIAFVTILTICSLFVMIAVQMVSAALSLRGKNLANALAQTFQTVAPELKEKAHQLAQAILSDPLLSDSMWKDRHHDSTCDWVQTKQWSAFWPHLDAMKLANAIRPEEVLAALKKLADLKAPVEGANAAQTVDARQQLLANAASQLLGAIGLPDTVAKDKLSAVLTIVDTVGDDGLKNALTNAVSNASGKLVSVIHTVDERLTGWLNAAQDRSQHWFQTQTRNITIAASIALAFVCQIDAVELFRFVSTDANARKALVDASAKIVAESGDALDDQGGLPSRVAAAWNQSHADAVIAVNPAWKNVSEVQAAVQAAVQNEIGVTAKGDAAKVQAAMNAYAELEKATVKAYFDDKVDRLTDLQSTLGATGFDLFPQGGRRWDSQATGCPVFEWAYWKHFPGMLLFAGLLSLGAPYWFNLLKNMASLRPALAKLIGDESKTPPPAS